jgi:hypothetical protein
MQDTTARSLRTAERFLLALPFQATLGDTKVTMSDISAKGARVRHAAPFETGQKMRLRVPLDDASSAEATVVWTHHDANDPKRWVSGLRTYDEDVMSSIISRLLRSRQAERIEELRSTDRFIVSPAIHGRFGDQPVVIENLSARGAGIEISAKPDSGGGVLHFAVPGSSVEVSVGADVAWSAVRALRGGSTCYRAGLFVREKPELMRLAIGDLSERNAAFLDTQSLRLKLKIMRARARQLAGTGRGEGAGIPAEQYLLIQGVREELRLNPDEAMHYYRLARLIINDPQIQKLAPPIASHPDALAVWEYLDRSIDPSIVGRAFDLPA